MKIVAKPERMEFHTTKRHYQWQNESKSVIYIIREVQEKNSSEKYTQEGLVIWHGLVKLDILPHCNQGWELSPGTLNM